jgi:hypothetical protein
MKQIPGAEHAEIEEKTEKYIHSLRSLRSNYGIPFGKI